MKNLLPGLRKFSERVFPGHQEHFESLAQGQKPHTLMITCSDSRIDPNLVTQTKPGELFVVRNAGNIVPPFGASRGGEEAAIEFAIDGLGVSNIVICGHSQCGAMAALAGKVNLDGLPCVHSWLGHAQGTKKRIDGMGKDVDLINVVEENVLVQVDNLRTHPSVSAALRTKRVQVFAWVYSFETGSIAVYDPQINKYLPSTEVKGEAEKDASRFAL
jgi:carbonic anhydrase